MHVGLLLHEDELENTSFKNKRLLVGCVAQR